MIIMNLIFDINKWLNRRPSEYLQVLVLFCAEKRQTMLFSATQTRRVEDLARISLKKEPLYVGVDDNKDQATVDGLEQVGSPSGSGRAWFLSARF